jgi:hypothetical protein
MKYYLHDANSFNDEKITELYINFGYEGLGLFYTLLEKLALQEKPIKTSVLKRQLNIGKRLEKCWSFMEEIGLILTKDGDTFNEQLLNFSGKYAIKKEKTRKRISEWREKQADTENVTRYKSVRNTDKVKESKVKESKVKESKEEKTCFSFREFWDMYNKKLEAKKCEQKYEKLTEQQRAKIKETLPVYLSTIRDKQYQKHPSTYLNNECWNDEVYVNPAYAPVKPSVPLQTQYPPEYYQFEQYIPKE